jgi:hypothetical protein
MGAAPIRIHRPLEREPCAARYAVDRGLGPDLVETGVEGLRGVEAADDDVLGEPRQPRVGLSLDAL